MERLLLGTIACDVSLEYHTAINVYGKRFNVEGMMHLERSRKKEENQGKACGPKKWM